MSGKAARAMRKVVHEAERQRIAPAMNAVAQYTKSTEERVSAVEGLVYGLLEWRRRGAIGRLKWLVLGR